MKIESFVISLLVGLITMVNPIEAQKVMNEPAEFVCPVDSNSEPIPVHPSNYPWIVFSDRSDNNLFKDENCTIASVNKASIFQSFNVIQESQDRLALKIVDHRFVSMDGNVMPDWQQHSGWVKKSELLLSMNSILAKDSSLSGCQYCYFNKKSILLFRPPAIYHPQNNCILYYANPECIKEIDTAVNGQVCYIFKETPEAYLVGNSDILVPDNPDLIAGWVEKSFVFPIKYGLLFEINWDIEAIRERSSMNMPVKLFNNIEDAEKYYFSHDTTETSGIQFQENITQSKCRCYDDIFRFIPQMEMKEDLWKLSFLKNSSDYEIIKESDSVNTTSELFKTGFAMKKSPNLHYPVFLNVNLISHEDIYRILYLLEDLVPASEYCVSSDQFRKNIIDFWYTILIEDLNYIPNIRGFSNKVTLNELSYILSGYDGKPEFKGIKLADVTDPDKFGEDLLYEYMIDLMITKGHIKSIYYGDNMFTADYFENHVDCYIIEYLIEKIKAAEGDIEVFYDPAFKKELSDRLTSEFRYFSSTYKAIPKFKVPLGDPAGLLYYWIDSRIFPHEELFNKHFSVSEKVIKEYLEKFTPEKE